MKKQDNTCPLCKGKIGPGAVKNPALDHCHQTGRIRDVLCVNCNGIEGRMFNYIRRAKGSLTHEEWLINLIRYWRRHTEDVHGLVHYSHKTEDEKRLARNAKARARRKKIE